VASLFISHSSSDRDAAERLAERLRAEDFDALFLDFDPERGIPAGRNWERELYAQLRKSDAVIFLASAASVASRWCFLEVGLARSLGKPVFPLRLEDDAWLELLKDAQWVDLAEGERAYARLWEGLRQARLDPIDSFDWDPTRRPYPGLQSFALQDAGVFFGRGDEINRLLVFLQPILQSGVAGRLVAIVGPSGSGKSSLLRAGLLPRLEKLKERWVVVPPVLPGKQPTRNLASSLAQAFSACGQERYPDELERHLGSGGPAALGELASELAEMNGGESNSGEPNVLVVVDQAEELITRSGEHEQQLFLGLLGGALNEESPLWVVATVRSEFLSSAPERAGLAEVVDDTLIVEPLSRARLPEVIERPAQRAGVDFETGLVGRMVEDTTGGDALPLLAYTLQELWELMRRQGRLEGTVSLADYEAMGGVVGALEHRADRITDELTRQGQGPMILPTLLKLASVEGEEEPTRRRVRRSALSPDEQKVVDAFVEARLLTSGKSEGGEEGAAFVEVAHEALLRQWEPLRQAIEEERSSLQKRSELERLVADWDRARKTNEENEDSYLLVRGRLDEFREWAKGHPGELGANEREFLRASEAFEERRSRRWRAVAGGLGVLLVISLIAGGLAIWQTQQARMQASIALSRQLLARASELQESQPDASLLVNVEALQRAPATIKEEARFDLLGKLTQPYHIATQLTGHESDVSDVAFNPDGNLLASAGGEDNTVRLWDVPGGMPHGKPLEGHDAWVSDVAFSPEDSNLLASSDGDGTVCLWDVESTKPHCQRLEGHQDEVRGVAFSPDGNLLATASSDTTVRLWDVPGGKPHGKPLEGHEERVFDVAFSPSGDLLASAGEDGTVCLWDVTSTKPRCQALEGHEDEVRGVAFSPDGNLLASASADQTVRLWDVESREPLGEPLIGHTDRVTGVAFSPDGNLLATSSDDMTVRLWDVESREPHDEPLSGHTGQVAGVAFSPDGEQLASASADDTVRLWDVESKKLRGERKVLDDHGERVWGVAFSPDGNLLASGGEDEKVRLWDVPSGTPHGKPLDEHSDKVEGVAFSPDGKLLASASEDRTVRLWDVPSGTPHGEPLTSNGGEVRAVAFSPDSRLLASAGEDGTVRLWDVPSGTPHGKPLEGHEDEVRGVAFSPDGELLASASQDQKVCLWDVKSDKPHCQALEGHNDWVWGVAFSPDGELLASSSDDTTVRLWDVPSGEPHGKPLTGHGGEVRGVAFSPDGELLASASEDQTLRLWDAASGETRGQPLTGHVNSVNDVAFSPDGDLLASASVDETVRLWDIEVASLMTDACSIANRDLSRDEWRRFVGPESEFEYERTCSNLPAG
jgi:WD40 repeat protein